MRGMREEVEIWFWRVLPVISFAIGLLLGKLSKGLF